MYGEGVSPADAGVRVVSPKIDLTEAPFGAYAIFAGVTGDGKHIIAAFGDGSLSAMPADADPKTMQPADTLDATPIAGAPGVNGRAALIGTDDGRLLLFDPERGVSELAAMPGAWVEQVASSPESGLIAFSAGRAVHVLDADGGTVAAYDDLPSTPAGLVFSPDGARLAIAHYGGVTVRTPGKGSDAAQLLDWHGSHTAVSWSPDGRFIVTAMQENEMHCWRMKDAKSLKMSGYPAKIRALDWTPDGAYVAVSGAECVTSWNCEGDGPMGKAPEEFGYVYGGIVSRVAARPRGRAVAGGYNEGTVMISGIEKGDALIARAGDGSPVTALAWSLDGNTLVSGSENGAFAVMRLADEIA